MRRPLMSLEPPPARLYKHGARSHRCRPPRTATFSLKFALERLGFRPCYHTSEVFAAARRSVDITTPYFVPDESSRWSIQDAVQRGVRIRLLVEGDRTDAMPVKYASRRT